MVGQNKLVEYINSFSIDTLPHTILLEGKNGSGKHEICSYISNKFGIQLKYIEQKINIEIIEELNNIVEPIFVIINSKDISIKEESVLLKFIEEPRQNIFIIITCTNRNSLLDTILNRCQVFKLDNYSKEELEQFYTGPIENKELLLQIAETPGQVKNWSNLDINSKVALANKIFDKVNIANLSNLLTLCDKINIEDENDFSLFVAVQLYCATERVKNNYELATEQYRATSNFISLLSVPNINKKYLLEKYIYSLKGIKNERV